VLTEFGGVISVVGGKWTTYRRKAVDALDAATRARLLPGAKSRTADLLLTKDDVLVAAADDTLKAGSGLQRFNQHCRQFTQARTSADVLARRIRLEFLDASAAQKAAARLRNTAR